MGKGYYTMNPFGLIGAIFLPMGALFTGLGIVISVMTGEWMFLLTFAATGLPFLIVGTVFICISVSKKRKKAYLLENGRRIYAKFNNIDCNYSVRINNAHPLVAICSYEDSMGNVHMFRSDNLKVDLTDFLYGKEIPVYVDGDNFNRYYMDLDSVLPEICVY